jgi:hypothetical protein
VKSLTNASLATTRGVALANKTARIAWAVMRRQEDYQRVAAAA